MSRFDRADFRSRYRPRPAVQGLVWPVAPGLISRVGDSITADRDGHGRRHDGLDIFAPALASVVSASRGHVLRVVDGRFHRTEGLRRAGLFVDVLADDGAVFRYLHLGSAEVVQHQPIEQGNPIGVIAPPFTSGLARQPHLHFEIRASDFRAGHYGPALDPRRLLPPLRA